MATSGASAKHQGPHTANQQFNVNPKHVICRMKPLRHCLEKNEGDVQKCLFEVEVFERTCDRRLNYIHDRDGIDLTTQAVFRGERTV